MTCSEWTVTICSLLSSSSVVLLLHRVEKASGVSDNKKPHPEEVQLPDFTPLQSKCWCHRNLPSGMFSFTVCCTNSFDQHMLYCPQSFVANSALPVLEYMIAEEKYIKIISCKQMLKWTWLGTRIYERAVLCLSFSLQARPVTYCDEWGIKSHHFFLPLWWFLSLKAQPCN